MEVGMEIVSMPKKLDYFEETELRLGLPGGRGKETTLKKNAVILNSNGKRSFEEAMDLKLNLSCNNDPKEDDSTKPPTKAQVVGWPPVRNFSKNRIAKTGGVVAESDGGNGGLVKVSMDGAPYLRKVDLNMYKSYENLSDALANMFSSFTNTGNNNYEEGKGRMIDFMKENNSDDDDDYVATYEDKDGDWMLVGDVPWKMFVGSCKRLRIMKGTDAAGLAPRAMEKCKNRSSRG